MPEVTRAGYYGSVTRSPSARAIRHAWPTDLITQIHAAPRGTYGAPRVHAELRLGQGIVVGHNAVAMLMRRADLVGLPLRRMRHARASAPTACDLVDRQVSGDRAGRAVGHRHHRAPHAQRASSTAVSSWMRSRPRVVGWSIDARQTAALVTNALGMAIQNRSPAPGVIVHADSETVRCRCSRGS